MKAIALDEFGGPEVLSLRDLPDPLLTPDGVLIDMRAAGVNPVDYKIREGYLRGAFPHHTPLIPGWDVAGVVAAVGPAVTAFAAGDEVYAYARKDSVQFGTYAEKVVVADRAVARRPASLSLAQAGAVPLAGLTALQSLRDVGVRAGDTVLVHAAAGGVGHIAVQLAVAMGAARVFGTASPGNHDFVRSLGAQPLSYGPDLPEELAAAVGGDGKVDVALDYVGGEALTQSAQVVRDAARHGSIVDAKTALEQGGRYTFVRPDGDGLAYLGKLADEGKLLVEVQQEFPLAQAAEAQRLLAKGHVRGKLVLTV
ncbi:NADP-dependent oxidoreductase [Rugosimonospora acidiphila]|uniref:NADP-dependent oxidoreductase n=1 Tax=Rugosimonospora acidiphila TaxID=556531 RepID=A0ABP9RXE9_9ACTN